MSTVAQTAVPIHAHKLAKAGDARALLAIPDGRRDIPRLIAGKSRGVMDYCGGKLAATELGSRKAITAAKAIIAAREATRADRKIAEAARTGRPGAFAAKVQAKRAADVERLRVQIEVTLDRLLDRNYRCATSSWAGGETTNRITLSEERGASGDTSRAWSKNGKWSGQDLTRRVKVSPRWTADVEDRGLAVVDGMVTTHATAVESPDPSIELYRAAWICQGRGMDVRAESGIIARHAASGTTYHSTAREKIATDISLPGRTTEMVHLSCLKAAVAGLKRKLTAQGVPPEVKDARRQANAAARAAKQAAGIARLVDRLARWDFSQIQHVVVERTHSLKAGNCESGTDQFIHRFFPNRDTDRATIGEIAGRIGTLDPAMLHGADLKLARQLAAACLVAIRKDRQASRALMA